METDPTRALTWLIGLPVEFIDAEDGADGEAKVFVRTSTTRSGCPSCGAVAWVNDTADVELIDLPIYGRAARTVWRKRPFLCPAAVCATQSFTEEDERIAGPRQRLTSPAGSSPEHPANRSARASRC